MFFKKKQQVAANVKKVSDIVNSTAHKEKKYISLMVVPSVGKTHSLHIPRAVFIGVFLSMFFVSALVAGFYLRGSYLENRANRLEASLGETRDSFEEYRETFALDHIYLRDSSHRAYLQLNAVQSRSRAEAAQQGERHQDALYITQAHVDFLDQNIRDLEEARRVILARLDDKSRMIPQIAETVRLLNESHEGLVNEVNGHSEIVVPPTVLLLRTYTPATETDLLARVETLANELQVQQMLFENIGSYTSRIDRYLRNYPTLMPIEGGEVTSGFGSRLDPITGRSAFHEGLDIPAPSGTPIMAAGGGTVIFEGWRVGFGNVIDIDHGFGIVTRYAHNSRNAVTVGQRVERGETIGYVGSTGRAISSHLHYEVLLNGRPVNPMTFVWE